MVSKLEHSNQVTCNEKTYRLAATVPLDGDWRIGGHGGDGVRAEGFDYLASFVSRKVEQVKIRSFIVALEGSGVSARRINSAFINVNHAHPFASPPNVRNVSRSRHATLATERNGWKADSRLRQVGYFHVLMHKHPVAPISHCRRRA